MDPAKQRAIEACGTCGQPEDAHPFGPGQRRQDEQQGRAEQGAGSRRRRRLRGRGRRRLRGRGGVAGPRSTAGGAQVAGGAGRLYGHTSWQMSQPKTQAPINGRRSGGMAPRSSMVR